MNELVYVVIDSLGQYPQQMFRDNQISAWVYITQQCPTQACKYYNRACDRVAQYQQLEKQSGFGVTFGVVTMSKAERMDKYIHGEKKLCIHYLPIQKINVD